VSSRPDGTLINNDALVALSVEAARRGDTETLEHALAAGVPVDTRSPRGDTLLMLAAYHGHVAATRLLLGWGSDPNGRNMQGETPLAGVAFKGLVDVAEVLVAGGADVNNASAANGRTPLMMAAAFNRIEMVHWLVGHGAARDLRDAAGLTALDAARAMGAPDAAALLDS
jgi:ankyrin repeat protein